MSFYVVGITVWLFLKLFSTKIESLNQSLRQLLKYFVGYFEDIDCFFRQLEHFGLKLSTCWRFAMMLNATLKRQSTYTESVFKAKWKTSNLAGALSLWSNLPIWRRVGAGSAGSLVRFAIPFITSLFLIVSFSRPRLARRACHYYFPSRVRTMHESLTNPVIVPRKLLI